MFNNPISTKKILMQPTIEIVKFRKSFERSKIIYSEFFSSCEHLLCVLTVVLNIANGKISIYKMKHKINVKKKIHAKYVTDIVSKNISYIQVAKLLDTRTGTDKTMYIAFIASLKTYNY